MLSIRQVKGISCLGYNVKFLHTSTTSPLYEIVTAKQTPTSGVAITSKVKKLNFPPFIKDMFVGKFNKSMLSYAEVLNYERHKMLESKVEEISTFLDNRKTDILDVNGDISPEIVQWCKTVGLHGLLGPVGKGGKDLLLTEVARIYEELGREISLSEYLYCSDILGYRAILEFGNARQQEAYLESLSNGSQISTLCFNEESSGSDPSSITMTAKFNPDDETYYLSGTKKWVANPYLSNLYIVFVKTRTKNYMGQDDILLSAFIVDSKDGGVSVKEKYETTAFSGLSFADVEFNCKVSKNAFLGKLGDGAQIMQTLLNQNKFLTAAGIITNLKSLLNHTIEHCNTRKQFGLHLSKFPLVKQQIAEMSQKLYCLESMVYMTAGLFDISEYPDVDVESSIIKVYASETSEFISHTCSGLLGSKSLLEDSPAMLYVKQSQFLQNYHGSSNILKTSIAISGILHMFEQIGQTLIKKNSGLHPITSLSWAKHIFQHKNDMLSKTHKLSDCVHPRMMTTADKLEYVIEKIPFLASSLFIRYEGLQIPEHEMVKLADLVIESYAMTCALSRSNRSYIVGNLHGEHEINLAVPYINDAKQRCKQFFLELTNWEGEEEDRNEKNWLQLGYFLTEEHRQYKISHPLTLILLPVC